jgi:hypothetical protein
MEGARDVWRGAAREKAAGLGAARVAVGWRMDPGSGAACGMAGLSKCTRPAGNRTGHAADSQHTPG